MSEASRVEELMSHAEPESFDLHRVLASTVDAYRDVYKQRHFTYTCSLDNAPMNGAPELLIQMLDKLVDNAVDFSEPGDSIGIDLYAEDGLLILGISNPGPPLPEHMRTQMFDSLVSIRGGDDSRHLGLGLYVAKLIAEGHGGNISADNIDAGVRFEIRLPSQDSR
jgi:signal transduction histidine kinase